MSAAGEALLRRRVDSDGVSWLAADDVGVLLLDVAGTVEAHPGMDAVAALRELVRQLAST